MSSAAGFTLKTRPLRLVTVAGGGAAATLIVDGVIGAMGAGLVGTAGTTGLRGATGAAGFADATTGRGATEGAGSLLTIVPVAVARAMVARLGVCSLNENVSLGSKARSPLIATVTRFVRVPGANDTTPLLAI